MRGVGRERGCAPEVCRSNDESRASKAQVKVMAIDRP